MAATDTHATHSPSAHATEAEPQTPMWLPAVGVFLFLIAGVYAVTTRTPDADEGTSAPSAAQTAAAAKPAATALPRLGTARPSGSAAAPAPGASVIRLPNGMTIPRRPPSGQGQPSQPGH